MHAHTHAHREPQSVPPFAITPTKRLSSLLSHTQAGSQCKPMDQFSTEKLWHSSNVMGFDVDAELHYRTPMKPVKPLFICLLPMQRTLAGNMPHFSYAASFFSILCKEECGSWHAHLHLYASSSFTSPHLVSYDWSLPTSQHVTFHPFVTLICSFVATFQMGKPCPPEICPYC